MWLQTQNLGPLPLLESQHLPDLTPPQSWCSLLVQGGSTGCFHHP